MKMQLSCLGEPRNLEVTAEAAADVKRSQPELMTHPTCAMVILSKPKRF